MGKTKQLKEPWSSMNTNYHAGTAILIESVLKVITFHVSYPGMYVKLSIRRLINKPSRLFCTGTFKISLKYLGQLFKQSLT